MFAVRIVDADFYVTKPTAELDVLYSEFRGANVTRVPVIRIFGSTRRGQKTCLHVHQVFPYIFVPYDGTEPREKYLKQLATSIDFAVQVALGKATSATNHVFNTEIVKRIPFYGYHESEQEFIKIQFYNPRMVAKVVDLLQNGAILNKIFQPYEAHIPYLLQFFIDFNLYGMNLLYSRKVHFRGIENSPRQTGSPCVSSLSKNDSGNLFDASAMSWQNWNKHTIPSDLCLGAHVAKTSRCELEVDVIAEDILNQLEIGTSIGHNPGIAAMWEDEKQRRRDNGQSSQISIPVSQDRGEMTLLPAELDFRKRIQEIIRERNQMIQSQLEVMETSLSPEELQELSQSILLDGKDPCSQTVVLSQDVDENVPVIDESIIEASQSQPNSLSGHIDEELVAMLLSLAEDPNNSQPQECSPNASQIIEKTESDDEDEESIIMSQPVWNEDGVIEESQSSDEDEEDWTPQRLPQLDGAGDDNTPSSSNRSAGLPTRKRKKIIANKETKSDDEDDFRIKKKSKITRQRKAAVTQLNIVGGKNRKRPTPPSNTANRNEEQFPNLESFHQSSKPRRTDKRSLGPSDTGGRRDHVLQQSENHAQNETAVSKNKGEHSKNKKTIIVKSETSKNKKDELLHLETESSGSQTSEFELRLSDSPSDGEDFECKEKVPNITANKIGSFRVEKQERCGDSRDIVESRKRRTTTKKATCLMFSHVGNRSKPERKVSSKQCSRNDEIEDREKNENTIHKNSKKDERRVSRKSEDNQKENTANEGGLPGNRILLDACVKLEKISVEELKSKVEDVMDSSSQNVKKTKKAKAEDGCSTNFVIEEKLDSLYQMAMLSPKSVRDGQESPPIPSSPSQHADDQNLDASPFYLEEADEAKLLSLKTSTVPFPITFVKDEDVKSIRYSSSGGEMQEILQDCESGLERKQYSGETYSKPHCDSEENNLYKSMTTVNETGDQNDIATISCDELDKDGTKCDSMSQTINLSHEESEKEVWRPAVEAPSPSYVSETRSLYGLPHERHEKAFCSDPKDVPSATRIVGGRRLLLPSLSVNALPEFDLGGNFRTLREFRGQIVDKMDNSLLRDCLRSLDKQSDDDGCIEIPTELKLALMEDHKVVITPVKLPPSPKDVREWIKKKKDGEQQSREPAVDGKKSPEEIQPSNTSLGENSRNSPKDNIPVSERRTDVFHSPKSAGPALNFREMSQPDILIGPQHSTPVGNPRIKSEKFCECTPIEGNEVKFVKQEVKMSEEEPSCKVKSLRRNILNSQVKDRDCQERCHQQSPSEASYIEGPTPTNSFGFKISQPNIQDAKSVREIQFLTSLSVELHVRTRKSLCPDPEFDAICAIFYHIEHETVKGKQYETGIIVVRDESTKLRNPSNMTTVNASTSMENTHPGISRETCYEDHGLIRSAGISNGLNIITEHQETDAVSRLIKLVHEWDPDILLGFEVQMLSWGYLIQRAGALGIDVASQLSRVQDTSGTARFDAEKDQWGASKTSEISISGRIVLNVWRLMRHEVTLNVYSFENISYHVLHERIPLYTYRQLTRWWDQKLPHNRWRTVDHYVTRCQGNIKILNHVDFINRTSEFARLYGILFYSVISRGSQFRVESMMLRLAKPMNYLAVSPSIQQRARMDAPECIPLVMEPESRFYTDPVIVLDFQSLYPSMMIAYNYCFSTCLGKVSRLHKIGNFDFGCTSLNVPPALLEKLEDNIHVSANGSVFVKPQIRRGILPRMVEEILETRVMVKKAMKEHKNDKVLGQLLDARQLGLKLIANVTYGYTSANFSGRMPCVEIADAIVRKARETLERAVHLVNSTEEWGARVVYGDTDSLFVLVKGVAKERAFEIGKEIVHAVTAQNPKPVKLKFEKVYLPCVLQTKKRYVGYMYETLEQKEPVFDAKGIETVRRDTCPAVAKILEKSLRILFEEKDVSLVKKFVQRQFQKLMEERVSPQDFIFAKEYRGLNSYKPTACVPSLEIARRQLSRDRRAEPRVGERVPYVVVNGAPGLPLIQLVRSPGDLLEDSTLRLNSSYYINKQILPPLNRVFSLIGVDVFTWYTQLPRYAPRHHLTTDKQKASISRFFTTLHCPVCEQLTQQGLCRGCRDNPQKAVVLLAERVGNWERKYSQISEVCFQCCGTRDEKITCVSLSCPVMFKRIMIKRNLEYGETLRGVQKRIEVAFNST